MDQIRWRTAIAETSADSVHIRGYDISDLAEAYDFGAAFYLIACGELPSAVQAKAFNAMMIEACERGITPSSSIARTVASCGAPLQAAVAAGILTFGDVHGGVGTQMAQALSAAIAATSEAGRSDAEVVAAAAKLFVDGFRARGQRVPGYGQPLHPDGDPRARRLMAYADSLGVSAAACAVARAAEGQLEESVGKPVPLNVDGAIACIAVDIDFPAELIRGVNFVARAAGLCGHVQEEVASSNSFRVLARESEVAYVGVPKRDLP